MSEREVIETRGNFRAVIVRDESPHEPEFEAGCPVLRVEGGDVTHTGYGESKVFRTGFDEVDALQHFVREFGQSDGLNVFERYIKVFHGGTTARLSGQGWRDPDYIAFTTRTLATTWGFAETDEIPEASIEEWEAYVEGDVWLVEIEERTTTRTIVTVAETGAVAQDDEDDDTWQDVQTTAGYYGEKYAREAALEELDHYAPKEA